MQIKCNQCGIPFTLSKEVIHSALDTLHAENLKHYDVRCPNCRKMNRISQQRLMRAAPDWGKESESPQAG
jgi:Zn finger protein HypA/HybF involved in hydrogenase expression